MAAEARFEARSFGNARLRNAVLELAGYYDQLVAPMGSGGMGETPGGSHVESLFTSMGNDINRAANQICLYSDG